MNNYGFTTESEGKVQQYIDGQWDDIGLLSTMGSYILYVTHYGDNPDYRAIDQDGNVIENPLDRKAQS